MSLGGDLTQSQSSGYWSSTTYLNGTVGAWNVNFSDGTPFGDYKSYPKYVRAVRGGS